MDIKIKTKYSIGDTFKDGFYEVLTIMLNIRENNTEVLYNVRVLNFDVITVDDSYLDDLKNKYGGVVNVKV